MSSYLKKKYGYKSLVIFPPSLKKIFKKKRIKRESKMKRINIVTVCRLSKEKNLSEILQAINILQNKNIFLNIIGEGSEKLSLKREINNLNLNDQIKFHGKISDVTNILKKNHLYVNSSYFEGFPNSVVEAANMGIPVIASQSHGGINEILSHGKNGTIYKNGYVELASCIKKYINDPIYFLKKADLAKKEIAKFNLKNHKEKFENLLIKI